jgi:hypothetical protein
MQTRRLLVLSAVGAIPLLVAGAGGAAAMPAGAGMVTVVCGSTTYQTWTNGNGSFTAAHDVNSTSTLIPLAFGPSTFTVYDPSGAVVDQENDPASVKGMSSNAAGAQWCSYTLAFSSPDGFHMVGTGTVMGKVTPVAGG